MDITVGNQRKKMNDRSDERYIKTYIMILKTAPVDSIIEVSALHRTSTSSPGNNFEFCGMVSVK